MKNLFLLLAILILSSLVVNDAFSVPTGMKKRLLRVGYYKNLFGHVHRNPSRYSSSMTTMSCGHPVKLYSLSPKSRKSRNGQSVFKKNWNYVKVGPYEGYVMAKYISRSKPTCFQDRYPRFFDNVALELSDMYYWGKLFDQYVEGRSKVR